MRIVIKSILIIALTAFAAGCSGNRTATRADGSKISFTNSEREEVRTIIAADGTTYITIRRNIGSQPTNCKREYFLWFFERVQCNDVTKPQWVTTEITKKNGKVETTITFEIDREMEKELLLCESCALVIRY